MLHLLLLYFIGKRFYDLADEYNQRKWLYAILGIVVYYASALFLGFVLAILALLFEWGIDLENSMGWNLLGIPVGLLAVWGFYVVLENKWKKTIMMVKDEIQDIGKNSED